MNILSQIKDTSFIPTRCANTAETSATLFEALSDQYNLIIKKSDNKTDYYDHIDYYVTLKNTTFTVDIKSAKKFFENTPTDLLSEWVWIELRNVQGRDGWLYGKADYIVYVFLDQAWFVNRKKLIDFVAKRVIPTQVTSSSMAKYHYYQRAGRNDLVTLGKLGDIKNDINPTIIFY